MLDIKHCTSLAYGLLRRRYICLLENSANTAASAGQSFSRFSHDLELARINYFDFLDEVFIWLTNTAVCVAHFFDTAYVDQGFEGIPHPAIYILDKYRKVIWAKVESDYRKRPTNDEIRIELDKLNKGN